MNAAELLSRGGQFLHADSIGASAPEVRQPTDIDALYSIEQRPARAGGTHKSSIRQSR